MLDNNQLKALQWAQKFHSCAFFCSNQMRHDAYSQYDAILAVAAEGAVCANMEEIDAVSSIANEWKVGFLSYELKNEIEQLDTCHCAEVEFPLAYFFIPEYVFGFSAQGIQILKGEKGVLKEIYLQELQKRVSQTSTHLQAKMSQEEYEKRVAALQTHIRRGDVYEINFCQEFLAHRLECSPWQLFERLNQLSPMPFAGFFKYGEKYVLSASPERYLAKRGSKLISQPIKGTAPRIKHSEQEDAAQVQHLLNNAKERSENVMIVDLVRNDLTKCALPNSVRVEELAKVYSFEQVHQMISTIVCDLAPDTSFVDILKATFPMGSMTGAPKIRAMQLIDEYELSQRGLYSGSMGYIAPNGDFDFNVVIRSILYDREKQLASFQVGSAITHLANPSEEYQECLLKAKAIVEVLTKNQLSS